MRERRAHGRARGRAVRHHPVARICPDACMHTLTRELCACLRICVRVYKYGDDVECFAFAHVWALCTCSLLSCPYVCRVWPLCMGKFASGHAFVDDDLHSHAFVGDDLRHHFS